MHHSEDQLDTLWAALKSDDAALRAKVLQRYANPMMRGAQPQIVCDDAHAQVRAHARPPGTPRVCAQAGRQLVGTALIARAAPSVLGAADADGQIASRVATIRR